MKPTLNRAAVAAVAAVLATAAPLALSWAAEPPTSGPAAGGSPAWRMLKGVPDPGGRTSVDANGVVTVLPRNDTMKSPVGGNVPACAKSTICTRKGGPSRQVSDRVTWDQTMGYTYSFPFALPPPTSGTPGGAPGAAVDSQGNVWIMQRKPEGQPQLYKFDRAGKLILTVPASVTGYQQKAHGIAVDPHDNVWIADTNGATVLQISPDGRLLRTLGVREKRGDWDEAKGQRLLWQPVSIAFSPAGDMYIGEGHANEGPNDVEGPDPANVIGAARILHFDPAGNFVGQWFGDDNGPGKFGESHGLAVDPKSGEVWVGDREQYRIIIFSASGKFVRTLSMRNLPCSLAFDPQGNPWMGTGQDGQVVKLDREGRVLGAVGRGMGIEPGQFIEANYFAFDKAGALYVGDTSISRVTKINPPARRR